jgi:hypothetical protein
MLTRVQLVGIAAVPEPEQTGFVWVNPWGVNGVEPHAKAACTWVRMDDGYTYLAAETAEEIAELVNTELDK